MPNSKFFVFSRGDRLTSLDQTPACLTPACRTTHTPQVMLSAYRRLASTAPTATNFCTGAAVMAVGDAAVQLHIEKHDLDSRRLAVCSSFNAFLSVPIALWYAALDRRWPGTTFAPMVRKVLVNQAFSSTLISPGFLVWSNALPVLLDGGGATAAKDASVQRLRSDGTNAVWKSFVLWLPANTINFLLVPQVWRVAYMSCIGVGWGGYLSYRAHLEHLGER